MQPLIAVVGRPVPPGAVRDWPAVDAVAVPSPYVESLRRAGAVEAVLAPIPLADAPAAVARFDGILLMGGDDIDPTRYGGNGHTSVYGVHEGRDETELAIARAAVERGVPTLAICRGIQLLNVALGGTLDPHIPDRAGPVAHREPGTEEHVMHDVRLEPGTRTAAAMGGERPSCASTHHQAVEKLGEGLTAVGWADDGIVEAVEHDDGWVVGVQWHPERTAASDPAQQGLFDALARRAAGQS